MLVLSRALGGFVLLFALSVPETFAQSQYCAQRISSTVLTGGACFGTLAEAEAFLRTEPVSPVGNSYMEQVGTLPLGLNWIQLSYGVRNKPYESLYGAWYFVQPSNGGAVNCDNRIPLSSIVMYGCANEGAAVSGFFSRYNYQGLVSGGISGNYGPRPPQFRWETPVDATTGRSHVGLTFSGVQSSRRLSVLNVAGQLVESAPFTQIEIYTCPALFLGQTYNTTWPSVCVVRSTGVINVFSAQSNICKAKDGNPCNAATGNKEYGEVDFEWEGLPFRRAYNSLRDFELRSGLGDNWAHSFSDRLIMRSNVSSDMIWLRSDGYFEVFSEVTTGQYRSRNEVGVKMVREPDALAAQLGRWRVAMPNGRTLWFDGAGRLARVVEGPRTLILAYCTGAGVTDGTCLSADSLLSVVSATGRRLDFEYAVVPVPTAGTAGGTRDQVLITRVRANSSPIAEYDYDTLGRLISARLGWPAPTPGRTYLYAEASGLCRDASGGTIAACNPAFFPHHMTGVLDESAVRIANYRYDQLGRVTASEGAAGVNRVSLAYSSTSTEVQLPTGSKKIYDFASGAFRKPTNTRVLASNGAIVSTATSTYTDFRATQEVAADGSRTNFVYENDRETSRTEGLTAAGAVAPETRTVQTDWHSQLNLPVERRVLNSSSALVARTAWTYNDRGQIIAASEIDPTTSVTRTMSYAYCTVADVGAGACPLEGLLKSVDGPRADVNDVTTYGYYATSTAEATRGDLQSVTNPAGQVTRYTRYDGLGKPLEMVDVNSVVTNYVYDHRQRLTGLGVAGQTTVYDYWPTGLIKRITQPDASWIYYEYDDAHRLYKVSDNLGNSITYTLDNVDNRVNEQFKDPSGTLRRSHGRVIDALGRIQQITGRE